MAVGSLSAQPAVSIRAGLVYRVEGAVTAGGDPLEPGSPRMVQLALGDELETRRGFAEISLGPDRTLRVAPRTKIELIQDDIEDAEFRIHHGSVYLDWKHLKKGPKVRILTGDSAVELRRPGLYRVDCTDGACRLRVYEGRASLADRISIAKGREIALPPGPEGPRKLDLERLDFFDRWNARRARAAARMARAGVPKKNRRDGFPARRSGMDASVPGPGYGAGPY